ncbi:MAG TPA: hypothetical protein VGL94_19735 [Ktedonobacteraceae bacterium]|jgi:hypothetical protein
MAGDARERRKGGTGSSRQRPLDVLRKSIASGSEAIEAGETSNDPKVIDESIASRVLRRRIEGTAPIEGKGAKKKEKGY